MSPHCTAVVAVCTGLAVVSKVRANFVNRMLNRTFCELEEKSDEIKFLNSQIDILVKQLRNEAKAKVSDGRVQVGQVVPRLRHECERACPSFQHAGCIHPPQADVPFPQLVDFF